MFSGTSPTLATLPSEPDIEHASRQSINDGNYRINAPAHVAHDALVRTLEEKMREPLLAEKFKLLYRQI